MTGGRLINTSYIRRALGGGDFKDTKKEGVSCEGKKPLKTGTGGNPMRPGKTKPEREGEA